MANIIISYVFPGLKKTSPGAESLLGFAPLTTSLVGVSDLKKSQGVADRCVPAAR